jgi:hypothetical protein
MSRLFEQSVCRYGRVISLRGGRGILLSLFILSATAALAQLTTGTISGTVTDPSGAAVPGAAVVVTNVNTGITRNTTTGPAGRYEAPNLPVGQYEVRASLTGFQTSIRAGIELTVGRNAVVDHALQVGEVTQQVTVTGEAPLVQTSSATVSQLVDAQKVEDLPLNNRDLTQLSFLQPGVIKIPRSDEFTIFGGSGDTLSVGGARSNQNVYLLDGMTNSDLSGNAQGASGAYAGAETVKEFQIITNNYSAEYRSQAGAIISAVTKSGTNAFHGSVFEFLRNDNFDATNFFANASGSEKPEFKRNQFGGAIGGPIIRDRTFFFGSYEGTRERLNVPDLGIVPSLNARQGILVSRTVTVNPAIVPTWICGRLLVSAIRLWTTSATPCGLRATGDSRSTMTISWAVWIISSPGRRPDSFPSRTTTTTATALRSDSSETSPRIRRAAATERSAKSTCCQFSTPA